MLKDSQESALSSHEVKKKRVLGQVGPAKNLRKHRNRAKARSLTKKRTVTHARKTTAHVSELTPPPIWKKRVYSVTVVQKLES